MLIDRLIYPISSLGPGRRLVIWTMGCSKRCPGCANPELWPHDPSKDIDVNALYGMVRELVRQHPVDGLTITGGDPLEQPKDLLAFLKLCRPIFDDILLYTGFYREEIKNDDLRQRILGYVDVLIDGPYVEELNDNKCVLRGSGNQRIWITDARLRDLYATYEAGGRLVQNVYYNNRLISVGIHNRSE